MDDRVEGLVRRLNQHIGMVANWFCGLDPRSSGAARLCDDLADAADRPDPSTGSEGGAGWSGWVLVEEKRDCACGHLYKVHTSHGCLSCDCEIPALPAWAYEDELLGRPADAAPTGSEGEDPGEHLLTAKHHLDVAMGMLLTRHYEIRSRTSEGGRGRVEEEAYYIMTQAEADALRAEGFDPDAIIEGEAQCRQGKARPAAEVFDEIREALREEE